MSDILQQLENDARRQRVARRLPEGTLTQDQIAQVADDFGAFLSERNITLSQVEKELGAGYSVSHMSAFRQASKKQFMGDSEKIARGINAWMENFVRRAETPMPSGYVETRVAKRMLTVIFNTMALKSIGLIYGPAGVGKTMVLQVAHAKCVGSISIRIRRSTRRATGLAQQLALILKTDSAATSFFKIQEKLTRLLEGSNRMLLIDQAHQLAPDALEFLMDLHDETGVPIVLCGTKMIEEKIDDTQEWFGQLSSRTALRYDATEDCRTNGGGGGKPKPLFSAEEVRRVFESDTLRLTDDGAAYLGRIANALGKGGLRLCRKIIIVAVTARPHERLDAKILRSVMRSMQSRGVFESVESVAESYESAAVA